MSGCEPIADADDIEMGALCKKNLVKSLSPLPG